MDAAGGLSAAPDPRSEASPIIRRIGLRNKSPNASIIPCAEVRRPRNDTAPAPPHLLVSTERFGRITDGPAIWRVRPCTTRFMVENSTPARTCHQ